MNRSMEIFLRDLVMDNIQVLCDAGYIKSNESRDFYMLTEGISRAIEDKGRMKSLVDAVKPTPAVKGTKKKTKKAKKSQGDVSIEEYVQERCDRCNMLFTPSEDTFLGSLSGDNSCHPLMHLDVLCSICYRKHLKSEGSKA